MYTAQIFFSLATFLFPFSHGVSAPSDLPFCIFPVWISFSVSGQYHEAPQCIALGVCVSPLWAPPMKWEIGCCLNFMTSSHVVMPTLQTADFGSVCFSFFPSLSPKLVKKTGYVVSQRASLLCSSFGTQLTILSSTCRPPVILEKWVLQPWTWDYKFWRSLRLVVKIRDCCPSSRKNTVTLCKTNTCSPHFPKHEDSGNTISGVSVWYYR